MMIIIIIVAGTNIIIIIMIMIGHQPKLYVIKKQYTTLEPKY